MKKILIPAMMLAVGAAAVAVAAAPGDPVLMTVNGKDVPVSEFIYLYEKNNQQQQESQSVDQYLDMFINYKLKVAAAEDAGVDTTAEFLKEYNGYANDLAAPYMHDTEAEEAVIANIKANSARNVKVSHIMLPPGNNSEETRQYLAMLDTIRTQILDGADFSEMALKYSEDPSKVQNLGSMGWITVNRLPYPFEKVAFETPVGTISEPFLDAPFGTHIIRVEDERPDPGEVKVAHILKLNGRGPRRSVIDASKDSLSRVQIDSLYQLAINGADFFELARENSEDPGSAENGGVIDFFGVGRMVPEFEQTAFALKDGEISEPIKTEYGYHIIKRLEGRPHVDEETLDLTIQQRMARDHGLSNMLAKSFNDKNRARFNARLLSDGTEQVKEIIIQAGKYDSAVAAILTATPIKLAQAGDRVITSAQVVAQMPGQTFDALPGYN
ncbi:MAG: peptidylprolyl isomerase, partial [Muribaculaceae bacterium]|nr:peptidylprolyl isomerase [Muribaculaceae bacterium]